MGTEVEVFETEMQLTPAEALVSADYKKGSNNILNFSVSEKTKWIKFDITNVSSESDLILVMEFTFANYVTFYRFKNDVLVDSSIAGDAISYAQREYNHQYPIFALNNTEADSSYTYLLKVKTDDQLILPLKIVAKTNMEEELYVKGILYFFFFGILLAIALYNLFIYTSTLESIYLFYGLYVIFICSTQFTYNGFLFRFVVPDSPNFAHLMLIINPAMSVIFATEFVKQFLQTKKSLPAIHQFLRVYSVPFYILMVVVLFGVKGLAYFIDILTPPIILVIWITSIYLMVKGSRHAKFFFVGWTIMLLGIVLFILRHYGFLPVNMFTEYTFLMGSVIEVLVLSYAIADKINVLKIEKNIARKKEIIALEENRKILSEQKELLEKQVKDRTKSLNKKNEELNTALRELRALQTEIDKMHAREKTELEQKNLQLQMNPHFLFNSLNSIQEVLMDQKIDDAVLFLNKYATLMRKILHQSKEKYIPLTEEIETLKLYISLEQMRFKTSFSNEILIDEDLEADFVLIPPMILQLYVENAIVHGLLSKQGEAKLTIKFTITDKNLLCSIEDNGIGREMARKLKRSKYKSVGIDATKRRLFTLGDSLNSKVGIEIIDKIENGVSTGTKVDIYIPIIEG